jgi:hypothetical protein
MIRGWNRVVAWFFGVPLDYASNGGTSRPDWIAHSRLAALVFFVVLPLSGASWYHLAGLLFPRSRAVQAGSALVMVGAVCLIDSILCRADGRKLGGTFAGWASLLLRLFFALCAATSLATGAVLLMLDDQLPERRHELAQQRSAAFRAQLDKEYDLVGLQRSFDEATKRYDEAVALGREPSPMLKDLRLSDRAGACGERQKKKEALESLAQQRRYLAASPKGNEHDVAQLEARIAHVGAELGREEQRCRVWEAQVQKQVEGDQLGGRAAVQASHDDAARAEEALRKATRDIAARAEEHADRATGGGSVLGENLRAAWVIVGEEGWAKVAAGLVFALVALIELAPVIGKLGLLGTSLGKQAAAENAEVERALARRSEAGRVRAPASVNLDDDDAATVIHGAMRTMTRGVVTDPRAEQRRHDALRILAVLLAGAGREARRLDAPAADATSVPALPPGKSRAAR